MDIKITGQGGQVNLNNSSLIENKKLVEKIDTIQAVTAKDKGYREEDIAKSVNKLNEFLKEQDTYAEYSFHKELGDVIIKIINKDTKEIVMECPPEKILDLVAKMMELVGISIDEKA